MPTPNLFDKRDNKPTERQELLQRPTWIVSVENWQQLGEVIATAYRYMQNDFTGTAELTMEDGLAKLEIVMLKAEDEIPF